MMTLALVKSSYKTAKTKRPRKDPVWGCGLERDWMLFDPSMNPKCDMVLFSEYTQLCLTDSMNTSRQLQSPEYDTNWASFLHLNIQWCIMIWFSYIGRNQIRLGNNVDVVQDTPPLPPLASAKVLTPPKCLLFDSNQSPTVQFSQCNKMELKRRWNVSRHCQNAMKLILMSQLLYTVQHCHCFAFFVQYCIARQTGETKVGIPCDRKALGKLHWSIPWDHHWQSGC